MGKITEALRKAAGDRMERLEKLNKIKERDALVVRKIGDSKVDARIVSYFDPKALVSEQYKILRTNILSLNKNKMSKVFVITSSLHSEGKTITSLNLAVTLAQATQKPKVLLIDADLRRGRMSKYLGVNQLTGMTEILDGSAKVSDVIFHIDIPNLAFIACGSVPENPAELLDSQTMRSFLADMKSEFDYILIDTPPIISVTDSGVMGALTDGVFMVVQAGRTQRGIVERATELLDQSHSKVLGHILTNIEYHLPEYIYRYL